MSLTQQLYQTRAKKEELGEEILKAVAKMKVSKDADLDKLIAWVKENRKYADKPGLTEAARKFLTMTENQGMRQGADTRFWSIEAPTKAEKRREMAQRCPGCFLQPKTKSGVPKYPICSEFVYDTNTSDPCQVSCKGVRSAKMRSRQWGDEDIAVLAEEIEKRKCTQ